MARIDVNEYMTEPRAHALYKAFLQSGQTAPEFAETRSLSYDSLKEWFSKFRAEGVLIVCPR